MIGNTWQIRFIGIPYRLLDQTMRGFNDNNGTEVSIRCAMTVIIVQDFPSPELADDFVALFEPYARTHDDAKCQIVGPNPTGYLIA